MRRYLARKVANALLTVVLVASFNFALFRILPGDPARLLLPKGQWSSQEIARQKALLHLDRPLYQQFGYYWLDTVQLKFGDSFKEQRPVTMVVLERVPATLLVVGTGTVLAMVVGLLSGIYAGWRRESLLDTLSTTVGMVFYATPTLWVGMILIMIFSAKLGWFPVGRMSDPGAHFSGAFEQLKSLTSHLVLPALTFGLVWAGQYQIIMRTSVSGVMNEDFVLTARAKGLSDNAVLWKHVMPNALLPTVTIVMMNLGFVMSGAILTETVFNWPGIGLLTYESMLNLDYPVMQAVFLFASVAVIVMNLIADIMYCYLDPRVQS